MIISVESEDAPTLHNSFRKGVRVQLDQVGLFVDGCAVKLIGENTFEIAKQYVDDTILVSIDETCGAIKDIFEDTRIMSEPAGALSLAGAKKYILEHKISNKNVIVINSGANLNFDRLKHVAERTESGDGREILLSVQIPEQVDAQEVGQLQLADFQNRTGLQPIGENFYIETTASGPPVLENPFNAGFGKLIQGSLESSNVNVIQELVDMIETQRAYEVNSKAISGVDDMLRFISQNL